MTREARLSDLLRDLYTPDNLRRFVQSGPQGRALLDELTVNASPTRLADEVVDALVRRGLVNAELFARLRLDRPGRSSEIREVAALWIQGPAPGAGLAAYHRQVRDRADVLAQVFRVPDGPTLLSDVVVEVRLAAGLDISRSRARQGLWGEFHGVIAAWTGHGRARDLPDGPFPLSAVATHPRARWAVIGEPGSGKTTALRDIARRLIDDGSWLPVLLKVTELRQSLLSSVATVYGRDAGELVMEAARRERAVILLDGLDEALNAERACEAVRRIAAELPACPIILSSRPIGFQAPSPAFTALAVCPLGEAERRRLLLAWVPDEARVDRALERLSLNPRLRELTENPLLLTLIALLLRSSAADLPRRRADLYDAAIQMLLTRAADPQRPQRRLREPAAALEVLAWVALHLNGSSGDVYATSDVQRAIQESPRHRMLVDRVWHGASGFIAELSETTALLVPGGLQVELAREFAFPHKTFREHLAAIALAEELKRAAGSDAVASGRALAVGAAAGVADQVLRDARARPEVWAEVLSLCCGRLPGALGDALIRRLIDGGHDRDLVLRVLADAEGIGPETVQRLLGLQPGPASWATRADLLNRLPELLGDQDLALRLLDRIRRTTTDGNDLYFIRGVLRRLARNGATPDIRRQAQDAAARVLDHLDDARLMEAQRQIDRRWRAIPPGRFAMGAQRPEGDASERPQHEVRVSAGFKMLDRPVTWRMYLLFDPGLAAVRDNFGGRLPVDQQLDVPVYGVTWYAATMFAEWVGARLPTEIEWEYACRAGTTTQTWAGDTEHHLRAIAVYDANSGGHPHPAGERPRNPWSLTDMLGGVWEWCLDPFDAEAYKDRAAGVVYDPRTATGSLSELRRQLLFLSEEVDPAQSRVYRGGSWLSEAAACRCATREGHVPSYTSLTLGFRLVSSSFASER